jgi:hypothetical protein
MLNYNRFSIGGWQTPTPDSIFNYGGGMDYSMMNPGMWPSFTGNGTDDYINQMKKYQDFYFDNNREQGKKTKETDLEVNAPLRRIQNDIAILQDTIKNNEQELIQPSFAALKESVKALHPGANMSDEAVHNEALAVYKAGTKDAAGNAISLQEHIRQYGNHSALQGLYQGLTLGFLADNKTAAENIADISKQKVSKSETSWKIAGNAAGGAVAGAGLYAVGKGLFNLAGGAKWLPKHGKIALIAGVVGAAWAAIKGLSSK